jgi:(2Fe-2S) ferredoxin
VAASESQRANLDVERVRGIVQHLHKTGKIVLKGIVSQINQRCFGKPTT